MVTFSRQLAMLLENGTSFLPALRLSREQHPSTSFKRVLDEVIEEIKTGGTFSSAVAKRPQAFPLIYGRMVKVGEQTGNLEAVLREAADNIERAEAAKKKVRGAMAYPTFILALGIMVGVIMVTSVLPPLLRLFTELHAQLPWTTRLLLFLSGFISTYKLYLAGAIILVAISLTWYLKRPSGHRQYEKLMLALPIVGRISLAHNLSIFCRHMSILLRGGLPMTEVVNIAWQSASSELLRQSLHTLPRGLLQGQGLSEAMKADKFFPSVIIQMVMTGEETNTLDSTFAALATHYESEFDEAVTVLTSALEPLMMLAVGLLVAFLAVSVIMPMYSIYNALG